MSVFLLGPLSIQVEEIPPECIDVQNAKDGKGAIHVGPVPEGRGQAFRVRLDRCDDSRLTTIVIAQLNPISISPLIAIVGELVIVGSESAVVAINDRSLSEAWRYDCGAVLHTIQARTKGILLICEFCVFGLTLTGEVEWIEDVGLISDYYFMSSNRLRLELYEGGVVTIDTDCGKVM